jgi:hypothetical protein
MKKIFILYIFLFVTLLGNTQMMFPVYQTLQSSAKTTPSANTSAVTLITSSSASCGGEVLSTGGFDVTARGVCWSTSSNPTISNSKTSNGSGLGLFTSSITGLSEATTYYVRSYATNSLGTVYGNQVSFTTAAITWTEISSTYHAATSGWTQTLSATNSAKQYKLIVSGTWGIANGRLHRDAAYDCGSNNTIGVSGTPIANRGCDANWSLDGSCPPAVPNFPSGYATDNVYTYLLGAGKSGGIVISFSDGGYGDNRGGLTFKLYESN